MKTKEQISLNDLNDTAVSVLMCDLLGQTCIFSNPDNQTDEFII